jgi:hypothetical protein
MEPEGSLPHSQVPATCLYPEPAQSSPYPHIPLPEESWLGLKNIKWGTSKGKSKVHSITGHEGSEGV